jgi:hypothetical protein
MQLGPNIALQRTPSASPPSPLSFGTLGGYSSWLASVAVWKEGP